MCPFNVSFKPPCSIIKSGCQPRRILRDLCDCRQRTSDMLKDASKCLEIAGVAGLFAQYPILCSPEEVCIQRRFLMRPAHTSVIVEDDLLRQTTVHALPGWIRWSCDRLPRLRLSLGNHQFLSMRADASGQLFPFPPLPNVLASIQVERS